MKTIRALLSRTFVTLLVISVLFGGLAWLRAQDTVPPANPITERLETSRIPLVEAANIEVEEDVLDLQSDVKQADKTEAEPETKPEVEPGDEGEWPEEPQKEAKAGEGVIRPDSQQLTDGLVQTGGDPEAVAADGLDKVGGDPEAVVGDGEPSLSETPGAASFELPTDVNYFFVDIIDPQNPYTPNDPRCFYRITHTFPQLEVDKVLFFNNGEPISHYGGIADEGWLNLQSGENWLSARVTYKLPNGTTKTFERATEPAVVILRDPLDIHIETDLQDEYDNPVVHFKVSTYPAEAHVQVYLTTPNGREKIISVNEDGNLTASLGKGINKIRFVATARGWKRTELVKTVSYTETKIRVYSPDLAAIDYRNGEGYVHYEKSIRFSTRVEDIQTGAPVAGVRMDIYLGSKLCASLVGGDHDDVVIDNLPLGLRLITIVARGANAENNATEFKAVQYQVLVGQGEETPPEVLEETVANANIGPETIVHSPVFNFQMSPMTVNTTGETYPVAEHKVYVYHSSQVSSKTQVIMRENIMGLYCYSVYLNEGLNTIDVTLVTDELYNISYQYKVYYIPQEASDEPIGSIYISVDAAVLGLNNLAAGYVDIYEGEPLSYAVLELLRQHGYQVAYTGESNYAMYLQAIIKTNMMAGWDINMVSEEELSRIEEAGGPDIWHGSYDIHSLGERDFTNNSGWLIYINGNGISGLSNVFPSDGDTCRMTFTLIGK